MTGISLDQVKLSKTGFEYDRFWMLTDDKGKFITQREDSRLALFTTELNENYLTVSYLHDSTKIPLKTEHEAQTIKTKVWSDQVSSQKESRETNNWFSNILGYRVILVRPSEAFNRKLKQNLGDQIHYPDAGQYLFLGQSSLNHLNRKLSQPIGMDRFRPNVVFTGGKEHTEDSWSGVRVRSALFEVTESCGRCRMITINQQNGETSKEPLKTISKYRLKDQKICFGQYLKLVGGFDDQISVGDEISIVD